jgi:hypothetical protein
MILKRFPGLDKPFFLPGAVSIIPKMLENPNSIYWQAVQDIMNTLESGQWLHNRNSFGFNNDESNFNKSFS